MRTTILSATLLLATLLPAAHAGDPCGEILDGLGHSLAGNFQPVLNGSGCLDGSGDLVLELYGMPVFSQVYLVIGLSNIEAPFKQGVLVPSPDLILPMPTGLHGQFQLAFAYPAFPSGTELYWQHWTPDAGAPGGFAASNAVATISP